MNYDDNTLIIGLKGGVSYNAAIAALQTISGFIAVIERFILANALLIQIDPTQYEQALRSIRALEQLFEFVDRNFSISPASFESITNFEPNPKHCPSEKIHKLHHIRDIDDPPPGMCSTIALIDTGISPHPYLPAISFYEMLKRDDSYSNKDLSAAAQINFSDLVSFEEDPKNRTFSACPASQAVMNYLKLAEVKAGDFFNSIYDGWASSADAWYHAARTMTKRPDLPPLPIWPKFFGQLRRISPLSINVLDNNLDIQDTNGHGTQMAGIISGYSWIEQHFNQNIRANRVLNYEFDVKGISPFSELLIIKCFDENSKNGNWVSDLLRGIQYAFNNQPDIITIALQAPQKNKSIPGSDYMALDRSISRCHNADIPVICPAGNADSGSTGSAGMMIPAACHDAWAITSVYLEHHTNIKFAPHSMWANTSQFEPEAVSFSAFGGDKNCKILTTSKNFGFDLIFGTSVAAAIATGILARHLSKLNITQIKDQYKKFMNDAIHQHNSPPSKLLPINYQLVSIQ